MNKVENTTKLSTIADIIQGQSPESKFYSEFEGMPFLQGNRTFGNQYPFFDTFTRKVTKVARKGDVLMSVRAPVGALNFAPCDLCIGRGLASIRAKDGDNQFVYYALKYNINNLIKKGSATTFDSVNKDIINDFELIIPNNKEDRIKASKVLSDLDKKIDLNNQINKKLEEMAKLIYDYWFVQFDFPDEKGKPYKSSGGKMVYNEELKREIPEGWEVKRLGSILKTVLGGTPSTKKKEYWDNGEFYWLNSGEIANFPIISSELKITKSAINNSATSLMPRGTVAISITRHIRPSILAIDACANQSVIGILESEYYKCSFIYPLIKNEVPRYLTLRTGAQQPHINKQTIDNTLLNIPKIEVLNKYYGIVKPLYNQINNISFQNQQLTELRDWLLPMLMNGQVRVKDE